MDSKNCQFMESISNLFEQEKFSDKNLTIIELKHAYIGGRNMSEYVRKRRHSSRKTSSIQKQENIFCTLPVHTLVLSVQSNYFEKLFEWWDRNSSRTIEIKVNEYEGQYLKLLIECLYKKSILATLEPIVLVEVIKMADRYLCETIFDQISTVIPSIEFKMFAECLAVVDKISNTSSSGKLNNVKDNLIKKCSEYASSFFCPLEEKIKDFGEEFKNLPFNLLLGMLKSQIPLCFHENSVLFFLILWFEHDVNRQTTENIELTLTEIFDDELSIEYLIDIITAKHEVLTKSPEFLNWFVGIISGVNRSSPLIKRFRIEADRNFKGQNGIGIFRLEFKKVEDDEFVCNETIVYKGYHFKPYVSIVKSHNEVNLLFQCLNFKNKYTLEERDFLELATFEIAIAIQYGSMPRVNIKQGFQDVEDEYLMNHSSSLNCENGSTECFIPLAYIDEKYYESFNEFSLTVSIVDSEKDWPDFYPRKFHSFNDYTFYIKAANNQDES